MQRRIETERLVLEPVTAEIARAVIAGDRTMLDAGEGWPHEDTVDAMSLATEKGAGPAWLMALDSRIIGDCGTFGGPDRSRELVIGYGVAAPYRGRGYATEAMAAVCTWLFSETDAARITALDVLAGNAASRRVLEKLGFTVTTEDAVHVSYALSRESERQPSSASAGTGAITLGKETARPRSAAVDSRQEDHQAVENRTKSAIPGRPQAPSPTWP